MAGGFDINDRSTWAWTAEGVSCQSTDGPEYYLDPESPYSFYQCSNGVPYLHHCPDGQVFNPAAEPGPVCDSPFNRNEAAVYDWAVKHGQVTDQR
jgi:Chitin binding Peritrophin-A domain